MFDTNTGNLLHTFDNPTPAVQDYFGNRVAIDGNRILIAALNDSTYGEDVGQAYLYDATSYNLVHTLNDPTVTGGDTFGGSVALQGNIVIVGAPYDDTSGEDVGQVHLFDADSGDLLLTLDDPTITEEDNFGIAVAAAGDYLVVGASGHDYSNFFDTVGQAHIFVNAFGALPVIADQAFSVAENSIDGTLIGTLIATDADGDTLTYSIANNVDPDGDGNAAFRIEGDGLLINDADEFDYEANTQLVITAEASDGLLSDAATITVSITNVDEQPVITLLGDSPYVLEASTTVNYSDPGATAADPEDGDLSGSVAVSGQIVNMSQPGTYLIDYDVQDSGGNDAETVTRTVLVQDTLKPIITLVGDAVVTVTVDPDSTYSDPGATAYDALDGDLTGSVVISGDVVDIAQVGTYTLTYNVSDTAGNAADTLTRTVHVVVGDFGDAPAPYPVTLAEDGARHGNDPAPMWQQLGSDIDGEAAGDTVGYSISISDDGNTVAVGTSKSGTDGAAYTRIYSWDGATWNQLGSDIDCEEAGDGWGGMGVSLSGDGQTVVIGLPGNDDAGHTRVYHWDGADWNQLGGDIDGEAAGDGSGDKVVISSDGGTVAIGARYNDAGGNRAGHVRIFSWDGAAWSQRGGDFDGEDAWNELGTAISLSGDGNTVAIGSNWYDGGVNGTNAGRTQIFSWDGAAWNQLGSDIEGETIYNQSGTSVSLSSDGNTVAIGIPEAESDTLGHTHGHTQIFSWDGAAWNQLGSNIEGRMSHDREGMDVSLSSDGQTVAISASAWAMERPGHTRICTWDGVAWNQLGSNIQGEAAGDNGGTQSSNAG